MITQIKTFLEVTLRNFGRNRLRTQLLSSSDSVLEDMGFSRELLLRGISAWPWRVDDEHNDAKVYSIFSEHEKGVRQAIHELESYTDRELADIGIARCDIESFVRNGHGDSNNVEHPKAA
jgi:uncharacterized protein YjiS (DUF1127 family)